MQGAVRRYEETMGHTGHRLTPQRRHVFDTLMARRDHPTATEVFLRAKDGMPTISLATVYNCLETLVQSGLVRQVNVDREPTRFCPNLEEHGHFVCGKCGKVIDIDPSDQDLSKNLNLPSGFTITSLELTVKGTCAPCQKN